MNSKTIAIVTMVALSCLLIPCMNGLEAEDNAIYYDADNASYEAAVFINEIDVLDDLDYITADNNIIIKDTILNIAVDEQIDRITTAIMNGSPMIVEGDASILMETGMTMAIDPNSDVSAIYRDPTTGTIHCYGVESDANDAVDIALSWVESVRNASVEPDTVLTYTRTLNCDGDKAQINGTAFYTKLGNSFGKTYYSVKYSAESVCKDGKWSTADIRVICDVDKSNAFQGLVSYGPSSSNGEITQSVGINLSTGGAGMSASWSYTISETEIQNNCNTGENYFDINHNTNENHRQGTIVVQPGMIVYVNDGSHYTAEDVFKVNYHKPYYKHLWPWDPDYEFNEFTLTVPVVINP